jgi:2,4-dienoyl-CoA reductase (NADPH2)
LTVPHRLIMGSMHLGLEALDDGGAALAAFYAERAAGGAALIVTGGSAVSRVGAGGRSYGFVNEDADAAKLEQAAIAAHSGGAKILLQLFHAGRYALERSFGLRPVAPSAVYSSFSRCEPRALSAAELEETIGDFARAAGRARELGFDGVELMGSEGYLLNQFMAPATNHRDDEWGGDSERRMRFPLAVAEAVRAAGGPGQALVYRISGADLVEGGATGTEVTELARRLAAGGVDALNVGIGWHEAKVPTVQGVVPPGAWRPWARELRSAVEIPVIASNRIDTAALADQIIAAGDADFASLARPFLADPEFARKSHDGRHGRINRCIACNACIDRSIFDRRVSCLVNPRAGYELELPAPQATGGSRISVAVIGGGPAGMEAARALAASGHEVTLFEAAQRLGGQFRMASRIPGKEDFERTIEYFEDELPRLGAAVVLGTPVADAGQLQEFDAVVVATGVVPRRLELPGAELPHVQSYAEMLADDDDDDDGRSVPGPVVIIGAGGIGVDVAHRLVRNADGGPVRSDPVRSFHARFGLNGVEAEAQRTPRQVTLMRRGRRVAEGVGPSTRWVTLQALERAGVEILTEVAYERIERGAVVIRDATGEQRQLPARTVVVAAGQLSQDALVPALSSAGVPHVVIGGAANALELDAERAFREGAEAPAALQRLLNNPASGENTAADG